MGPVNFRRSAWAAVTGGNKTSVMKRAIIILLMVLVSGGAYAGKCTGKKNCKACKTCRACEYCHSRGGKCGVCKPEVKKPEGKKR